MRGHSARGRKHTEFVVLARVSDTDCRGWKRPEKPTEIAPQLARFHTVRYELSLYRPVAQFSKLDPCDDPSRICRGLKQRLEKKQKQSLSGKSRVMMWRWPGLGNGALEMEPWNSEDNASGKERLSRLSRLCACSEICRPWQEELEHEQVKKRLPVLY